MRETLARYWPCLFSWGRERHRMKMKIGRGRSPFAQVALCCGAAYCRYTAVFTMHEGRGPNREKLTFLFRA